MKLEKLLSSPLSPVTAASARQRRKELGKTKNAFLTKSIKTKNSAELTYSSPATYRKDKYSILIQIKKEDIKVYCSCDGFHMQGFKYRCWKSGAGIQKENREDSHWRSYHGPALFCKHLELLFRGQELKKIKKIYGEMV